MAHQTLHRGITLPCLTKKPTCDSFAEYCYCRHIQWSLNYNFQDDRMGAVHLFNELPSISPWSTTCPSPHHHHPNPSDHYVRLNDLPKLYSSAWPRTCNGHEFGHYRVLVHIIMVHKSAPMDFVLAQSIAAGSGS